MPYCNTDCMNVFIEHLSKSYPDDMVILVYDGAAWHKASTLIVPENICITFIPPYTPDMNPIEQIWKVIKKIGFRNEIFQTLDIMINHLCKKFVHLSSDTIKSITSRDWIASIFN